MRSQDTNVRRSYETRLEQKSEQNYNQKLMLEKFKRNLPLKAAIYSLYNFKTEVANLQSN